MTEQEHCTQLEEWWSRAKLIVKHRFGGGRVTQVSRDGFHYIKPEDIIPTFVEWPRSGIDQEGKFGRVS